MSSGADRTRLERVRDADDRLVKLARRDALATGIGDGLGLVDLEGYPVQDRCEPALAGELELQVAHLKKVRCHGALRSALSVM